MQARIKNPVLILPDALQAVMAVKAAVDKGGLPEKTLELVHMRVSQINGSGTISSRTRVSSSTSTRFLAREHPELWSAFQRLGEAASRAGPLDERTRRLVHVAFAIATDSHGATHSHARRALADGIGAEEIDHVALLAVTTLGWSGAIKGLAWVRDVTRSQD